MKLEDQVCSLELAKRLKELGAKQESLFYYAEWQGALTPVYRNQLLLAGVSLDGLTSAFTVAELGKKLPEWCGTARSDKKHQWGCVYEKDDYPREYASTEADARAKMLIYLIEKNLVAP